MPVERREQAEGSKARQRAAFVGRDQQQHFFFFQAEDGIRDLTVTGVQTCALPISVLPVSPDVLEKEIAERDMRETLSDGPSDRFRHSQFVLLVRAGPGEGDRPQRNLDRKSVV